jgi:hypothetical protein
MLVEYSLPREQPVDFEKNDWLIIETSPGGVLLSGYIIGKSENEDGPFLSILVPEDQHGVGHLRSRIVLGLDIGIAKTDPPDVDDVDDVDGDDDG